MQDGEPTFNAASVQNHFVILAIFWWIGLPLYAVIGLMPDSWETLSIIFNLIAFPTTIVASVYWCILLYRHWSLLQGPGVRTTPGKAVGFGFIPFYCFYWWFISYACLAPDTNEYLKKAGISSHHMSFGLAVSYCVLSVLACTIGFIPVIGSLLTIPTMIIGFILVVQQRDCILAILKHRSESRASIVEVRDTGK